jgi:hypothetical protein
MKTMQNIGDQVIAGNKKAIKTPSYLFILESPMRPDIIIYNNI